MRISDWSSDVCSSDLEIGLEAWAHRRAHRPRQRREQDDAEGEEQRGVKPCGVDAGRSGFEYHEGRSGIDAPAHDAAVLDLGGEPFAGAGVAPYEGFDFDPVARAGAEAVERGNADLAVLGQPDGRLAEQAEQAHDIGEGAAAADR